MTDGPSDVVSFANDKRLDGMPRELKRRLKGGAPQPPALWTFRDVFDGEDGLWGAYPRGFVRAASQAMRKMVGNGVPLPMGRAVAKAVRKAVSP